MARPQIRAYTDEEIRDRLATDLPGWSLDAGWIVRRYRTDGWPHTLLLVNHVGFLAEAADHHPDLVARWSEVEVRLQTHHAGGVTAKDVELAALIERSAFWRPAPDSALRGPAEPFVLAGDAG